MEDDKTNNEEDSEDIKIQKGSNLKDSIKPKILFFNMKKILKKIILLQIK